MKDQQKFIDQLKNSRDPNTATKGCGYFIIWADGRAKVGYKNKQDAIDFINQGTFDMGWVGDKDYTHMPLDVVAVKYREAEKGERVRNKFTEASAKTYRLMKKAWDNPPRDDATYPGSNVSGPVPHSTPKSPSSKPRRDQRTIEDYHAPSQLDRDPIPGDTQPEQGTGGQSHSGEPDKVDNIYPEPSNWLRPLKGLPFTDEHLMHDFNEDFDTEYYIRQRGLNMRRVKKALNMKKAQEVPKWTDPKFLGSDLYDFVKIALRKYQPQIQEDPTLKGKLIDGAIPHYIEQNQDIFIAAGITLPIMLEAIKEAANLLMVDDQTTLDTSPAERKAAEIYPDPRQQTSEIPQMTNEEGRLLNTYTADQIWDIVRNPETANTPEGQAARGLIEKGIVANKLNMRKKSGLHLTPVGEQKFNELLNVELDIAPEILDPDQSIEMQIAEAIPVEHDTWLMSALEEVSLHPGATAKEIIQFLRGEEFPEESIPSFIDALQRAISQRLIIDREFDLPKNLPEGIVASRLNMKKQS
ncbi:hypothetical protein KA005_76285, partial [bacterium]|nr:hypothetical protein [bacterium]